MEEVVWLKGLPDAVTVSYARVSYDVVLQKTKQPTATISANQSNEAKAFVTKRGECIAMEVVATIYSSREMFCKNRLPSESLSDNRDNAFLRGFDIRSV